MKTFLKICIVLAVLAITMTLITVIEFRENKMSINSHSTSEPLTATPFDPAETNHNNYDRN